MAIEIPDEEWRVSTLTIESAARVLADPRAYAEEARLHAALTHLRANAQVAWVDAPGYRPFWAITKHADVTEIERSNVLFTNSPRPVLGTAESDALHENAGVSTLIHLDGEQHRKVQAIAADWFRPKAMRAMKTRIDELAKGYVDDMLAAGGAAAPDFGGTDRIARTPRHHVRRRAQASSDSVSADGRLNGNAVPVRHLFKRESRSTVNSVFRVTIVARA